MAEEEISGDKRETDRHAFAEDLPLACLHAAISRELVAELVEEILHLLAAFALSELVGDAELWRAGIGGGGVLWAGGGGVVRCAAGLVRGLGHVCGPGKGRGWPALRRIGAGNGRRVG